VSLPTLSLGIEGWTLRAWRESDASALAQHANNPNVWRNMSDRFPHPYTQDIAEHWVNTLGGKATEESRKAALLWSLERGFRSGRVAWQFARDWVGRKKR